MKIVFVLIRRITPSRSNAPRLAPREPLTARTSTPEGVHLACRKNR